MFRHFIRSIDKRYQYDYPKAVVLKGSTIRSIASLAKFISKTFPK